MEDLILAIKEWFHDYVTHRLFPLSLFFLILFGILILRLFNLQIVEGQEHLNNFTYRSERTLTVEASRGCIFDRNGYLLAYNELSYNVTFGNSDKLTEMARNNNMSENELKNQIVYNVIKILEQNNDKITTTFPIKYENGEYKYTVEDSALLRFLQQVYSAKSVEDLTPAQRNATAKDVVWFFRNGTGAKNSKNFDLLDEYSDEDALKIISLRYDLWLNRYQQYVPVVIAENISEESITMLTEGSDLLPGIEVQADSRRVYNDAAYFAHIIGYIGNISSDEIDTYNENLTDEKKYSSSDMIGKMGLERTMESTLRGTNGVQKLFVDKLGKVLEVTHSTEAIAGQDLYLTIDRDLQMYCYQALEKEIAGILLAHLSTEPESTEDHVCVPINDVYFALIDNNTLSIEHMKSEQAGETERAVYAAMSSAKEQNLTRIRTLLTTENTPMNGMTDEYREYMEYIYKILKTDNVFDTSLVLDNDETYAAYMNETISLADYLHYGITLGCVQISSFDIESDYYDSDEVYQALLDYIDNQLREDEGFQKLVFKYMIKSGQLSGTNVCLMLYDQNVLDSQTDEDFPKLLSGSISSYTFMENKIRNLEITPAQLALDPCSGSVVVTDANSGEVLALVSYPSYDNNRLTNTIDAAYYKKLNNDKTSPMYNRATQQRTAPGSTYKMLSSIAGVCENAVGQTELIKDESVFKAVTPSPKCWIAPSSHGEIDIEKALEVSCNYFYYEVAYRMSIDSDGDYNDTVGLGKLEKYAKMFGFDKPSGIELDEAEPKISTESAVRSAIGQGKNSYTATNMAKYVTALANSGTCYDLSLISKVQKPDGTVTYENPHNVSSRIEISDSLWNTVHNGMRRVITNNTPESSLFQKMNVAVAGKTGTAEEDKKRAPHALFVSYAPYEQPEVTVTTVIPFGYSSGNAQELASFVYAYMYDKELLKTSTVSGNNAHTD